MKRRRCAIGLSLLLAVSAGFVAHARADQIQARQRCVVPTAEQVLGIARRDLPAGFEGAISQRFQTGGQVFQWFAINSGGPPTGSVFVLDCLGHPLVRNDVGYVEAMKPGPVVAGTPTVEVRYIPGSGTGFRWQKVALLQFRSGTLSTLWEHDSIDDVSGGAAGREYRHFAWTYLDGGTAIEVKGADEQFDPANEHRPKSVEHTNERFCLTPEADRFTRCNNVR
jgi:hypothetical protein